MEKDQVFIRLSSGIGYQMNHKNERPIKEYIYRLGNPNLTRLSQIQATYQNRKVDLEKSLQENQIKPNSILHISTPSTLQTEKQEQNDTIFVFYEKQILTVSPMPNFTVGNIKQFLFEKTNIPIQQQLLVYQGKKLEDHENAGSLVNTVISLTNVKRQNQQSFETQKRPKPLKRFNSDIKSKNHEDQKIKQFQFKSADYQEANQSEAIMGVKVGPEFQSEEGGSVQSFGLKNMALKPNYFQNPFLLGQNIQEVVLTTSEVYDQNAQKIPFMKESYKISIVNKKNKNEFSLSFSQEHSIQDIKKLVCELANKEGSQNVKIISEGSRKEILNKNQMMMEISQNKVPKFEIQF